jgi:Mg2+-importing ATPase
MKYIMMATSSNFGNMFSMAGASLMLPFLPLLPKQILLGNMLTDFPEMSISTDSVDESMIDTPQNWDIRFIKKFMVVFGLASSICDYITFGVLLWWMHATPAQFQSGWFIESVVSAALIVLVIRTRQPFWKSHPSHLLVAMTIISLALSVVLPYSPIAGILGFVPLPIGFIGALIAIVVFYVAVAETCKYWFYKQVKMPVHPRLRRHPFKNR